MNNTIPHFKFPTVNIVRKSYQIPMHIKLYAIFSNDLNPKHLSTRIFKKEVYVGHSLLNYYVIDVLTLIALGDVE